MPGPDLEGPPALLQSSSHPIWRLEFRLSLSSPCRAVHPATGVAFCLAPTCPLCRSASLQERSRRAPLPRPRLPTPSSAMFEDAMPRPLPVPPPPPPHRHAPLMGVCSLHISPPRDVVVPPQAQMASVPSHLLDEYGMSLHYRLMKTIRLWLFPEMDRYTAQRLLRFTPVGCFIVRKGSQELTLALTVRSHTKECCDHYRIFLRANGLQVEGSLLYHANTQSLIEYYCLHQRELPYLLKLPNELQRCPSEELLNNYSAMGQAFWTALYPRPVEDAFLRVHKTAPLLTGDRVGSESAQPRGSYLSTRDARISYLSTKDPRTSYLSTRDQHHFVGGASAGSLGLSGASSVDSLLRSSDDRTGTSLDDGTVSSSAIQLTGTSAASVAARALSADNLCQPTRFDCGSEDEGRGESSSSHKYRASVTLRLGRSQSDAPTPQPSNYDAMWEARTGALITPEATPTSVPVTPPQEACPEAPPPPPPHSVEFDLSRVRGFPQPERFRQMFTFDGYTPRAARRAIPPLPSHASSGASDIYEDPLDLRMAPKPQPRKRILGSQLSAPMDGSSTLRGAVSDDSLSRNVATSLQQMHESMRAMEAELNPLPPAPPPALPPPGRATSKNVVLRPRPIPLEDPYPTASESSVDPPVAMPRQRRDSLYDNVSETASSSAAASRQPSIASSRGTVFSTPWDHSLWHQVLHPAGRGSLTSMDALRQVAAERRKEKAEAEEGGEDATPTLVTRRPHSFSAPDSESATPTTKGLGPDDVLHSVEEPDSGHDLVRKAKARLSEFIQPSGGRNVGASIDRWLTDLTHRGDSVFGQKVASFIECTRDASERNPHAVMRNIRQFMDGMKHYLVQRDETGFQKVVENERKKLASDEFLNVERRLESALYNLILRPLKSHVDRLIADWPHNADSMRRFRDNLVLAAKHSPERLGIRSELQPPPAKDLTRIRKCFAEMRAAYSPLFKLECLLKAVEIMYDGNVLECNKTSPQLVSTDDLMPIFTYVLVRCELYTAEFEADYMQGLLASKFLLGESAYYLSTLQAAVQVVKNFHRRSSIGQMTASYEDLSQLHGVLRVIVLNERTDSTDVKTFPARPTMTGRDLSILVAHRCHIFNPQDYGLYHFSNGKERLLRDLDLPHKIKVECEGRTDKPCQLLYKRTNAVFALPLGLSCGR